MATFFERFMQLMREEGVNEPDENENTEMVIAIEENEPETETETETEVQETEHTAELEAKVLALEKELELYRPIREKLNKEFTQSPTPKDKVAKPEQLREPYDMEKDAEEYVMREDSLTYQYLADMGFKKTEVK